VTEGGAVVGTIGYMSPEQVRGQPSTAATDFFSLGCILYEVLTGQRAFQRESVADTLSAILNDQLEFVDISQQWPDRARLDYPALPGQIARRALSIGRRSCLRFTQDFEGRASR
jgi:serine/threonine protein kinase